MRLKLDENLGRNVAEVLQQAGHDVATVPGQRLFGIEDRALIETCRKEERYLVTLDLEFGAIPSCSGHWTIPASWC